MYAVPQSNTKLRMRGEAPDPVAFRTSDGDPRLSTSVNCEPQTQRGMFDFRYPRRIHQHVHEPDPQRGANQRARADVAGSCLRIPRPATGFCVDLQVAQGFRDLRRCDNSVCEACIGECHGRGKDPMPLTERTPLKVYAHQGPDGAWGLYSNDNRKGGPRGTTCSTKTLYATSFV